MVKLSGIRAHSQPYLAFVTIGKVKLAYRIGVLHEQNEVRLFALTPEGSKHLARAQAEFNRKILPTLKLERPIWPRPHRKGKP